MGDLVYTFGEDSITLDLGVIPVSGNTKITIFKPGKKKELLVHFWFHCYYTRDPIFRMEKEEIDKAVSDRTHKIFPENFAIEVTFEPVGLYDGEDNQLAPPMSPRKNSIKAEKEANSGEANSGKEPSDDEETEKSESEEAKAEPAEESSAEEETKNDSGSEKQSPEPTPKPNPSIQKAKLTKRSSLLGFLPNKRKKK